jgi:hypothetical protein
MPVVEVSDFENQSSMSCWFEGRLPNVEVITGRRGRSISFHSARSSMSVPSGLGTTQTVLPSRRSTSASEVLPETSASTTQTVSGFPYLSAAS